MYRDANNAYLESRVLSAGPLELVRLLYQAGTGAVREARRHLAAGEIAARSRSISKACEILMELIGALDRERGGEIAERLAALYGYMYSRLLEANLRQSDAPLAEVLGLMATLGEGWDGASRASESRPPAATPWSQPMAAEPESACHAWSA
ncbi:MAG: flagellar export chaperone FliS [Acidobacteriia bacterium]|nr:flagellar export chaperone FliS [Terriglobia bacterium]